MSYNHISFKSRIDGELGLIFEFIKDFSQDNWIRYRRGDKEVISFQERGLFNGRFNIQRILKIYLFMTYYKMIDQLFEQILEDNNYSPRRNFWGFQEKIDRINNILTDPNIILPQILKRNNRALFNNFFDYYKKYKDVRNTITHKRIEIAREARFSLDIRDTGSSTIYSIDISPWFLIDKYYKFIAIANDLREFKIINRQIIMDEISRQLDQKIEKNILISNIGNAYEEEITYYLDSLIRSNILDENQSIISIYNNLN